MANVSIEHSYFPRMTSDNSSHSLFHCSGPLDEISVRGNIALNQQKVLNDYLCNLGEADEDSLEEEYVQMSAQVVRNVGQNKP